MGETTGDVGSEAPAAGCETRRVLIVVPVFTHVLPEAFDNFLRLALWAARQTPYQFDVWIPKRQLLHSAMNQAVQVLLDHGHIGMIVADDDCFPPQDAIPRLMGHAEAGRQYVAGVGVMRGYPHTTTIGRYFPEGESVVRRLDGDVEWKGFSWLDDISRLPPLVEADFCGLPIAWMARELFTETRGPWFGTELGGGHVTHDVYFARKVKAAGFKVFVDTTIRCGHMKEPDIVTFDNRAEIRGMRIALDAMKAAPGHGAQEALSALEEGTPA